MERPDPDHAADQLTSEGPTEFERLVRFIVSPGPAFGLALVRYNVSSARDETLARALDDATAAGVTAVQVDLADAADDVDVAGRIGDAIRSAEIPPRAVMVIHAEPLLTTPTLAPRSTAAFDRLNQIRDQLPTLIPCRTVFWLTTAASEALAQVAPDLRDVFLATFDFVAPISFSITTRPHDLPKWIRLAPPSEHDRLRHEQALLEANVNDRQGSAVAQADRAGRLGQIHILLGHPGEALAWLQRAVELLESNDDPEARARAGFRLGDLLQVLGQLDEALSLYRAKMLPLFEHPGLEPWRALTLGRIADILLVRGDLDEALRIRTAEELPVFESLGNVRSRAVTLGKIANIVSARGELDEALRIRTQEELPVYERLGDVLDRAATLGKIADILYARGELDEALRIRTQEQLPVFERLGDVRERAVTLGKIADILSARGELDEALRIRTQEQLPVFERLGDVRERAVTLGKIADILSARGELDEALRIRLKEQVPVYERLGDMEEKAHTLWSIGKIQTKRGAQDEATDHFRASYKIVLKLSHLRAICVVGKDLGALLIQRGAVAEGRAILERSRDGFRKLGDTKTAEQVEARLAELPR